MTIAVEDAQAQLAELIAKAARGERVVITQGEQPVAELVSVAPARPAPSFGSCRGMLHIVSEDDEHLADFRDYTE